ncbi:MAG: DUF2207 domain-containing protein [Propionibacteriaceae bacterium]|nr:DUF2207 domain-containing protein [Propionibacteriaceae bacterium]
MKRYWLVGIAALLGVALGMIPHQAFGAETDEFTRFEVIAQVDEAGVVQVKQTVDLKFASSGHGPYLWFVTRQGYDEDFDRLYVFENFAVSSPTGAPSDLVVTEQSNYLTLRIGHPDLEVLGTQTYVITYQVSGIVNPFVAESGLDEIFWNVIGTDWTLPIANISVTLEGPAPVTDTTCWMGGDFDSPCTAHGYQANTATFSQDELQPGQGLAVVGGWPAGTFPDAAPILVPNDPTERVTRLDLVAEVDSRGNLIVTQSFDIVFYTPRVGPTLRFEPRRPYDAKRQRLVSYGDFQAQTAIGTVPVTESGGSWGLVIEIGDPATTVVGKQTYTVTYTIRGLIDRRPDSDGLTWVIDSIMPGLRVDDLTITIGGPVDLESSHCLTDADCQMVAGGTPASYRLDRLRSDQQLRVDVTWPPGTFKHPDLRLRSSNPYELEAGGSIAALLALALCGLAIWGLWRITRRGRDHQWAYVAPGEIPDDAVTAPTVRQEMRDAPVDWLPPDGIPPRLAGAVVRERSDPIDLTATIIGLAVRGHILIQQLSAKHFQLVGQLARHHDLDPIELFIYRRLFATGNTLTDRELASANFHPHFRDIQRTFEKEFAAKAWYLTDTSTTNTGQWRFAFGQFTFVVGVGGTIIAACVALVAAADASLSLFAFALFLGLLAAGLIWLAQTLKRKTARLANVVAENYRAWGWRLFFGGPLVLAITGAVLGTGGLQGFGWLGLPVAFFGVGLVVIAPRMPVRSPLGAAAAARTLGFKKYLETAEVDQIRWEEASDIFSAYLPYAIVFGCAERWTKVFKRLVEAGVHMPQPGWYVGANLANTFDWSSLTQTVSRLGSAPEDAAHQHAARVAQETRSTWTGPSGSSGSHASFFASTGSVGGSGFSSPSSHSSGSSSGGGHSSGGVSGGGGGSW